MSAGFIKIRRGLREHLRFMPDNAVKLYLWLHLSAYYSGPKKGCVDNSYDKIADSLGWDRRTLDRAIAKLKPKFIEVQHGNQHQLTTIKILKYDPVKGHPANAKSGTSEPSAHDSAYDSAYDKSDAGSVVSTNPKPKNQNELHASKKAVESIEVVEGQETLGTAHQVWQETGVNPTTLPLPFRKLAQDQWACRNGMPLFEFMGTVLDLWRDMGSRTYPPTWAARKKEIGCAAEREKNPPPQPINYLPECPFQERKPWPKELLQRLNRGEVCPEKN